MYNKKEKENPNFLKFLVKKTIKIVPKKYTCLHTTKSSGCNSPHPRELSNGSKSTKKGAAAVVWEISARPKKNQNQNYLR